MILPLVRLVIFDCDGVLVDSELTANRVSAAAIQKLGWPITVEETMAAFMGLRLSDMPEIIAARIGRLVPDGWVESLRRDIMAALAVEAEPIPGAAAALRGVATLGLPYRVASNSSHEEMAVKFARTGLTSFVANRVHSARDVARGKPAPDLFLAAASAEQVPPQACLVVEDSVPGARAARAAGMMCLGLALHDDGAALAAEGATIIHALADMLPMIRASMAEAA